MTSASDLSRAGARNKLPGSQAAGWAPDRGVRHEIDLKPGSGYCVLRQWPLSKEQSDIIDALFDKKQRAGHSASTFCVRKPNGKWRIPAANRDLDDIHLEHLEQVLECMSENWLFANLNKCIFGADEDPVLGCFVGTQGVRVDPANIKVIAEWPLPQSQKDLRQYNFTVVYKLNVLADALSRRHDYELAHISVASSDVFSLIRRLDAEDRQCSALLSHLTGGCPLGELPPKLRAQLHRYHERDGLLYYSASLFLDTVFRHHGMPASIVSDRDPRFTSEFWTALFRLLGTQHMSTAAHPETDGQTEGANRMLEDIRQCRTGLLSTKHLADDAVSSLGSSKLLSRFIGPFKVLKARGSAYTLDLPSWLRTHPTFYVGQLKPYRLPQSEDASENASESESANESLPDRVPEAMHSPHYGESAAHSEGEPPRHTGPSASAPKPSTRDALDTAERCALTGG
ncbi:hypothetical protein P43SY_012024 [Pythium insidiosum]|uniref:Integrase catalytic domain-containing protein n=1 Tax=Pythium insidiosum TaxID=114742 RepID=A0AAD5Q553_PYTIN|nr:hypothetical protein P43SY_012024 [Pythium insidiosum]